MLIKLTNHHQNTTFRLSETNLARLALDCYGGGLNSDQSARAMEWQDQVLDGIAPIHFVDGGMDFTVWVEYDAETAA